ncbi:MAG: zf-HC2 domain-containing protein [Actinomycetota bacterium]
MSWLEHRWAMRRLDAYADDELGADDVDRVTGHIVVCENCATHLRFLLEVRASLQRFGPRASV